LEQLFTTLTRAVEGSVPVALAAALIWGIISVILSPCHLASIPLVMGFISEQKTQSSRRDFFLALLFSTGILITIAIIGVITSAIGSIGGEVGPVGNYFVAAVLFLVGLHLVGVIPMPFSGPSVNVKWRGPVAAFLLGLIYGIALGPCTFAYMAPILAVTLRVAHAAPVFAALLLLAYGIGHCAVITAAGSSTELVQRFLNWNERSSGADILRKACGVLVMVGGFYFVWKA